MVLPKPLFTHSAARFNTVEFPDVVDTPENNRAEEMDNDESDKSDFNIDMDTAESLPFPGHLGSRAGLQMRDEYVRRGESPPVAPAGPDANVVTDDNDANDTSDTGTLSTVPDEPDSMDNMEVSMEVSPYQLPATRSRKSLMQQETPGPEVENVDEEVEEATSANTTIEAPPTPIQTVNNKPMNMDALERMHGRQRHDPNLPRGSLVRVDTINLDARQLAQAQQAQVQPKFKYLDYWFYESSQVKRFFVSIRADTVQQSDNIWPYQVVNHPKEMIWLKLPPGHCVNGWINVRCKMNKLFLYGINKLK